MAAMEKVKGSYDLSIQCHRKIKDGRRWIGKIVN